MSSVHTFDAFITDKLNESQQQAVLHDKGPILVIAGAGSGKTRVITARITNLILHHQVPPSAIIALTFTNKAAAEMKERIAHFLGNTHQSPFIGTFHAYCLRLLKQQSALLNRPAFTIMDSDDQIKMITRILHQINAPKHITARNIAYHISSIKNQLIESVPHASLFNHPLIEQIYTAYEKEKKASNCFDFDDLMLEVLKLFQNNSIFKSMHQGRVRHLLVDEYQDTNKVQHELLKHMTLQNTHFAIDSLCAVGDADQSIYSWRGATIANMLHFQQDFTNTTIIKIEQNYRSVQPILDAANHLIEHNIKRNTKKLWSDKKGTDRIRLITCMSEYQEGEAIASCIKTAHAQQKRNSMAVLYRTHVQSRAIEEALIKNSIPYTIIGGIQFYERKEIKDLLAYLRLLVNPFDRPSFFRIINIPTRGIGAKSEELLYEYWQQEFFLNFKEIIQKLIASNTVNPKKQKTLNDFIALFNDIDTTALPSIILTNLIKKIAYTDYLTATYESQDAQTRIDNVEELIDAIRYMEINGINTTELFLHEVALIQEKMHTQDNQQDKVMLMSLHAAKGLEFDLVIIAGLEESIIPSNRSLDNDDAIEEERRLFYVGITRAKEHLLLTHTKYRYTYGKMVDTCFSRFLHEIPTSIALKSDLSISNPIQLNSFFSEWFGIASKKNNTVITFGQHAKKTISSPPSIANSLKSVLPLTTNEMIHSPWKKNQPVKHATYGMGIVEKTEKKESTTYVTVKFKMGIKKIVSDFLEFL